MPFTAKPSGVEQPLAIALFATPVAVIATGDLIAALAKWRRDTGTSSVETATRLALQLSKPTPDGASAVPLTPSPHVALIVLRGGLERITTQLTALTAQLTPLLDLSASSAVAGTEYIVKPDSGPVIVTMLVKRLATFSRLAFAERWRIGHAPFGRRITAPGYRQLHADAPGEVVAALQSSGLASVNDYDGVGCVMFTSLEQMRATRASPEVARDATADEMRFIDHSRSMLMAFERTS